MSLLTITLLGCQKEKDGYFEVHVSSGSYVLKQPILGASQFQYDTVTTTGHGYCHFTKGRNEYCTLEVQSLADSATTVLITIDLYYNEKFIDRVESSGINRPTCYMSHKL